MRRGRRVFIGGFQPRRGGVIAERRTWFNRRPPEVRGLLSYGAVAGAPSFAERIADTIWHRLPYSRFDHRRPGDAAAAVLAYVESLKEFHFLQSDVVTLIRAVLESNLEFRQQAGPTNKTARDKILAAKLDDMLSRAALMWEPPSNVISASLITQPIEDLHPTLHSSLRVAVHQFGASFQNTCERMHQQELLGAIEWLNSTTCAVRFARELIVQDNDGVMARRSRVVGNVQQVHSLHRGRHYYRVIAHEHLLMNAGEGTVDSGLVSLPPRAQRVAEAIPEWLIDHVGLVGGLLVQGNVHERDIRQAAWQSSEIREYGIDPAIVLDQYVLTGWNPPEAEHDPGWHARPSSLARSPVTKDTAQRQYAWWTGGSAVAATLVGLACGSFPTLGNSFWLVLFVAVSALAAMWAVHLQRQAANSAAQTHHYLTALFISLGLMAGGALLAIGLRLSSSPDIGAGGALLAASLAIIFLAPLWWGGSIPATTNEAASIV